MKKLFYNLFFLLTALYPFLSGAQELKNSANAHIEKGKKYCGELDFKTVKNKNTFLYCKSIYSQQIQYREALQVMDIAEKKFPYSYEVRLQKALALQQMGSNKEAGEILSGLIQLYPDKFELHNYMARLEYSNDRIKSLMPFIVSVIIQPNGSTSQENLIFIKRLLDSRGFERRSPRGAKMIQPVGENNFDLVNYEIAYNSHGTQEKNTKVYLTQRMNIFLNALSNTTCNKEGFFWNFYGRYFTEMEKQNLIESAVNQMLNKDNLPKDRRLQQLNASFGLE